MANQLDYSTVYTTASRALAEGGTLLKPGEVHWNIAGRCEAPRTREVSSPVPKSFLYEYTGRDRTSDNTAGYLTMILDTPCRHCDTCLRNRARLWRDRAGREILFGALEGRRTWFGTITMSPDAHYTMWCRALAAGHQEGDPQADFNARASEGGKEVTKWLKRVRKSLRDAGSLRYLLVTEAHKTGLPHWHILIHESADIRITHRALSSKWTLGHTNFKLVGEDKFASYVTKYLAKASLARVRASSDYGRESIDDLNHNEVCQPAPTGTTRTELHALPGQAVPSF